MYAGRLETSLFGTCNDSVDGVLSFREVERWARHLYELNCDLMVAYGNEIPLLYEAGVVYKTIENACGGDIFQDCRVLNERKAGDCGTLACYLAAERTVKFGVLTKPYVRRKWPNCDFALYHVLCRNMLTGDFDDPSVVLGMNDASLESTLGMAG